MASTCSVYLTCLCGAVSAPNTLLFSPEVPFLAETCHCNSCRYTTGSLGTCFPPQHTLAQLTAYHSSQNITGYFCFKCGCHCFVTDHRLKESFCLGGIIEQSPVIAGNSTSWPKDICKISHHEYVHNTVDGGLTPFLLNFNGRPIPTWSAAAQEPFQQDTFDLPHTTILSLPTTTTIALSKPEDNSCLNAQCHCGGVSLLIKRANHDLTPNSEVSARYAPSDPTKYLTYFCACRSCRLSTGVSLTPWALVPPANVFNFNSPRAVDEAASINSVNNLEPLVLGKPVSEPGSNPGLTLKHYWSSPDVCSSFCARCGATVSNWCGQRPDELDIAAGILRAEEGSMERRWLDWEWGRCSFIEESIDQEISEAWSKSSQLVKKMRA